MYYYIKGTLTMLGHDYAVIEAGGVGYMLMVSQSTLSRLSSLMGRETLLYTYLIVREDAQELYGFFTEDEKHCFTRLISVSGIGPKAAKSVLSTFSPDSLASLVAAGDAKTISTANGIGLKTAQRIIIELKGKLDLSDESEEAASGVSDAINALTVLGYSRAEAMAALKGIDTNMPLEDMITLAFKKLNKF